MDLSCIGPIVQTSGGSVMICECFNSGGLDEATLFRNKMKTVDNVQVQNDYLIPSMNFFFSEEMACFKMTMPRSTSHLFQEYKSLVPGAQVIIHTFELFIAKP